MKMLLQRPLHFLFMTTFGLFFFIKLVFPFDPSQETGNGDIWNKRAWNDVTGSWGKRGWSDMEVTIPIPRTFKLTYLTWHFHLNSSSHLLLMQIKAFLFHFKGRLGKESMGTTRRAFGEGTEPQLRTGEWIGGVSRIS